MTSRRKTILKADNVNVSDRNWSEWRGNLSDAPTKNVLAESTTYVSTSGPWYECVRSLKLSLHYHTRNTLFPVDSLGTDNETSDNGGLRDSVVAQTVRHGWWSGGGAARACGPPESSANRSAATAMRCDVRPSARGHSPAVRGGRSGYRCMVDDESKGHSHDVFCVIVV